MQARLEGAVVEVEATTLASTNKNNYMVPEEIRELESVATQCREQVKKRVLTKKAQKARRAFDARVGALPRATARKRML